LFEPVSLASPHPTPQIGGWSRQLPFPCPLSAKSTKSWGSMVLDASAWDEYGLGCFSKAEEKQQGL